MLKLKSIAPPDTHSLSPTPAFLKIHPQLISRFGSLFSSKDDFLFSLENVFSFPKGTTYSKDNRKGTHCLLSCWPSCCSHLPQRATTTISLVSKGATYGKYLYLMRAISVPSSFSTQAVPHSSGFVVSCFFTCVGLGNRWAWYKSCVHEYIPPR